MGRRLTLAWDWLGRRGCLVLTPRDIFIVLLLAAMEVVAAFSLVVGSSLLEAGGLRYSAFWLLLLMAAVGAVAGLTIGRLSLPQPWNRVALLSAGIAVPITAVALSRDVVTILVSIVLLAVFYWRGISVALEQPDYQEVRGRFGLGLGIFFIGMVWVIGRGIIFQSAVWHMLAFTGIAYLLLAFIAFVVAWLEEHREPGAAAAVCLVVVGQLGLLLLLTFLALQVFAVNLVGDFFALTHPIWDAIGSVIYRFALLLSQPIQDFIALIKPHTHHGQGIRHNIVPRPKAPKGIHRKIPKPGHPNPLPIEIAAFVFLAAIVSGIALLVWHSLPSGSRSSCTFGFEEERRSLWTFRLLWETILASLRALFRHGAGTVATTIRRTRGRLVGPYPDDPVRRTYVQLLRRAAAAGLPRPVAATAEEYRELLVVRWPEGARPFGTITDAYITHRYSPRVADASTVAAVRQNWQDVRRLIRVPRRLVPAPALADTGAAPLWREPLILIAVSLLTPIVVVLGLIVLVELLVR